MFRYLFLIVTAFSAIAAAQPRPASAIDAIARDYVRLSLVAGEREPGYVDSYNGPKEWAEAAKSDRRTAAELSAEAARLSARLEGVNPTELDPMSRRRRAALLLQLKAAETRMAMQAGRKFSFDAEAEGLFGVRPVLKTLASYDEALAEIERLVPGEGPLWQRVEAWRKRFTVPADKVDGVVRAAIAECRRRSSAHIKLPASETFRFELVRDKPWSGYNYYQGGGASLIQVNTDLPMRIDEAVGLGCHEGYPGHHVLYTLVDQRLAKGLNWIEYSLYPLYSPMSLVAEGAASHAPALAFPGDEQWRFEAAVLFPIAGLDPAEAQDNDRLVRAIRRTSGAHATIARDYLDGRIDRDRAVALIQRYDLVSPERAAQSIRFIDAYRSYVLNYRLGRELVAARVAAAGPDAETQWSLFERLISEPTIPADLVAVGSK